MIVFYKKWKKTFGDKDSAVLKSFHNLRIVWSHTNRSISNIYDINGKHINRSVHVSGFYLPPDLICVHVKDDRRPSFKISDTSFVHELVHVALHAATGTPDPDHEGKKYSGWTPKHTDFINEVRSSLKKSGL